MRRARLAVLDRRPPTPYAGGEGRRSVVLGAPTRIGPVSIAAEESRRSGLSARRRVHCLRPGTALLLLSPLALALVAACRPSPESPPVDAVQAAFRDGELTAREAHGKRVFGERCATCHGPEGRGDGQNAYNLQPPPPDFSTSLSELSVVDRRAVIAGGTRSLGRSALCPPWGRSLRVEEVEALLAYMEVMERPPTQEDAEPRGRRRWSRRP